LPRFARATIFFWKLILTAGQRPIFPATRRNTLRSRAKSGLTARGGHFKLSQMLKNCFQAAMLVVVVVSDAAGAC
jgi:hypothetical protein